MMTSAVEEICALDPELPFLAAEAAADLANLRYHEFQRRKAIHRLAGRLKKSIKEASSGVPARFLADPAMLIILSGAIAESSSTDPPSEKIDDLLAKVLGIAEFLSSENLRDHLAKLEEVMNFCAALSQAAIAYRHSLRDSF